MNLSAIFSDLQNTLEPEHPEMYEKIDWEYVFTNANINVNVNTKIINNSLTDSNAKKKY